MSISSMGGGWATVTTRRATTNGGGSTEPARVNGQNTTIPRVRGPQNSRGNGGQSLPVIQSDSRTQGVSGGRIQTVPGN
jgi:hypothetical protein